MYTRATKPAADSLPASSPCSQTSESDAEFFLESTFQDPCPTLRLNGTRRVTMPQVLTRRSEPIHPSTSSQARSPVPTNPKTGSGSDHPGGRSPHCVSAHNLRLTLTLALSGSGYCCTLSNCTHRLVSSHFHWVQLHAEQPHPSPRLSSHSHRVQLHAEQPHPAHRLSRLTPSLTGHSCMLSNRTHRLV